MNKNIELLVPAGSLEKVKWAVRYGADAVYIGGEKFSLRANAINFNLDNIKQAVDYCHANQVLLYVAVNIVFHEQDTNTLDEYLITLSNLGVDAVIMSDVYAIKRARAIIPSVPVHVSTQASIYNVAAAKYYESLGVERIVLARECPRDTIADIIKSTNLEVEVFIHGAMCSSFSGRCTLSNTMTNRDANHGGCSQVCRFDFDLLANDQVITSDYPFTVAAKDLKMTHYIKDLMHLGVKSLKIEGRMRSLYYIAMVTHSYRKLIDDDLDAQQTAVFDQRLARCANREAVSQFYERQVTKDAAYYNGRMEISNQDFLGIINSYDAKTGIAVVEERNAFKVGDEVSVFGPHTKISSFVIEKLYDEDNNPLERANHPHQIVKIKIPVAVQPYDLIHINFS